jgi:hypothetical protein
MFFWAVVAQIPRRQGVKTAANLFFNLAFSSFSPHAREPEWWDA